MHYFSYFCSKDCGYSLEPPEQKYEKYQIFLSEKFMFLEVKFSIYLNRRVFVMANCKSSAETALMRMLSRSCVEAVLTSTHNLCLE